MRVRRVQMAINYINFRLGERMRFAIIRFLGGVPTRPWEDYPKKLEDIE